MKQYYLVTDATVEQVEAATGLRGEPTMLGVLIEEPTTEIRSFRMPSSRCCSGTILHAPNCQNFGIS